MKLNMCVVPSAMVDLVWDKCIPHLERAIDRSPNDISLESIKNKIISGTTWLFIISEGSEVIGVNVCEIHTYETGYKVLYIPITAGSRLDEWMEDSLKIANRIALDFGCKELRGMVRPGWIKVLKSHGWSPVHTILKCPVTEEEQIDMNVIELKTGEKS